ncbi:hypothetical protein [Streptosporangium canum]
MARATLEARDKALQQAQDAAAAMSAALATAPETTRQVLAERAPE